MNPLPGEAANTSDDAMLARYWEDALNDSEVTELNRRLVANPELRKQLRMAAVDVQALSERFLRDRTAEPSEPKNVGSSTRSRRLWLTAFVTAACVALAAVFIPRPGEREWVSIEEVIGSAEVGEEGKASTIAVGQTVRAGSRIRLVGPESTAVLKFADDTRIVLVSDTEIEVEKLVPKTVRVVRGTLTADVQPQPTGQPLRITTPEAVLEVLGTQLSVNQNRAATQIGVAQGTVKVTRRTDGRTRTLGSGEQAFVTETHDFETRKPSPKLDHHEVAFNGSLPTGWRRGQFVRDDLPTDSRGAVRAIPVEGGPLGLHHQILSQNAWIEGLVDLHSDSWIHVRFRVEKPGFHELLLIVRDNDPMQKRATVLRAPDYWQGREVGVWHTVRLPLSQFWNNRTKKPPELPRTLFHILFDSHREDRGLTVERVWFTRGENPK
jgi:ferric-dicitrate binding protein FerR (iron transport regulator)